MAPVRWPMPTKAKECVEKNIPEEEAVEKLLELIRREQNLN